MDEAELFGRDREGVHVALIDAAVAARFECGGEEGGGWASNASARASVTG